MFYVSDSVSSNLVRCFSLHNNGHNITYLPSANICISHLQDRRNSELLKDNKMEISPKPNKHSTRTLKTSLQFSKNGNALLHGKILNSGTDFCHQQWTDLSVVSHYNSVDSPQITANSNLYTTLRKSSSNLGRPTSASTVIDGSKTTHILATSNVTSKCNTTEKTQTRDLTENDRISGFNGDNSLKYMENSDDDDFKPPRSILKKVIDDNVKKACTRKKKKKTSRARKLTNQQLAAKILHAVDPDKKNISIAVPENLSKLSSDDDKVLSMEQVLENFDRDEAFGPSTNITRKERFLQAFLNGDDFPSFTVMNFLDEVDDDSIHNKSVFDRD